MGPPSRVNRPCGPRVIPDVMTALTRLLWRRRYQWHLKRAYYQSVRAGYKPSDAAYARMERQARAYADGCGD